MKIKLISCEAFYREMCAAAAVCRNVVNIEFLPFGLHDTPERLRDEIQKAIDASDNKKADYIVLGYGLCSRGTVGVCARSIPIIIPKMHDCITAFLGSREKYNCEFSNNPGTYYFTSGWIERKDGEVNQGIINETHSDVYKAKYFQYVEKYGEDNANYIVSQEKQWLANYNRAAFINTAVGDVDAYRKFTKQIADERSWNYAEISGNDALIRNLLDGKWDENYFLKVNPGQYIAESFDSLILKTSEH